MRRHAAGLALLALTVTVVAGCSREEQPPASKAFCGAAERYNEELERTQLEGKADVERQLPLVADLARPALLGRYMALASSSWHLGFVLGAAIGGVLLDVRPVALWIVVAIACGLAAIFSLVLERFIPMAHRRTPVGSALVQELPVTTPAAGGGS